VDTQSACKMTENFAKFAELLGERPDIMVGMAI
jgi:hypothetical protein